MYDLISAVLDGRQAAEAMMLDTLTAYAPGARVTGPDGFEVPGYTTQGTTSGRITGRVRARDGNDRTVDVAGAQRVVLDDGLHVPIAAPVPRAGYYGQGWEYVVTAVGQGTDPALLGTRWLVVEVPLKSNATARRLSVAQVS